MSIFIKAQRCKSEKIPYKVLLANGDLKKGVSSSIFQRSYALQKERFDAEIFFIQNSSIPDCTVCRRRKN